MKGKCWSGCAQERIIEKLPRKLRDLLPKVLTSGEPAGAPVAMVHCNNCTNDTNAWVNVLGETAKLFGAEPSTGKLYTRLYEKSLEDFLAKKVFAGVSGSTVRPDPACVEGTITLEEFEGWLRDS